MLPEAPEPEPVPVPESKPELAVTEGKKKDGNDAINVVSQDWGFVSVEFLCIVRGVHVG